MAVQLGYGARVFQPIDTNPDSGGGPLRRATGRLVPGSAGTMVMRTPHAVVPDAEPGAYEPDIWGMKFLPDGRLVPAGALGAPAPLGRRLAYFAGFTGAIGAIMGAVLVGEARGRGAIGGAVAGLLLGALAAKGAEQ